jgi:eukaryotic-like serine/threonine-protein kinase
VGANDGTNRSGGIANDETVSGEMTNAASSSDSGRLAESDLPRGYAVGEYVIEEVLGRGGFGTVYRANQPVIGKRVAIKVLSRKYSADTEMVSRFTSEARAVNQIKHRHIIDIFSFGQLPGNDGRQYYVMEHLEGEPLDQFLASNGPLRLDQALPILRAVARALDAAHAKGVAHRDLKPENVFLARDDEGALFPKLLDFGIAKLNNPEESHAHKTNTGVPLGTPYYMSPEQCRGQNVDHRTDFYSFGVMAYRLLTGKFPFEGNLVDILHHHMYDEPPPPSSHNPALRAPVDAAISWMMQKEPANRPKTAIAAVVALADDKTPTPMLSGPLELTENIERTSGRKWLIPAIGLAVAAAAGVTMFLVVRGDGSRSQPDRPDRQIVIDPPSNGAPPPAVDAQLAVTVDAAAPKPVHVKIKVTGVPPGTELLVRGVPLGVAPDPIMLDRSSEPVTVVFKADGYAVQSKEIVPDKDQDLVIKLKAKTQPGNSKPPKPPKPDDPDALPSVNFKGGNP